MNRSFLILLMIGTAMMIAVIGQQQSSHDLNYLPWQIDRLENGSIRVFGITLGKTTVQEANQIFASFAQTRLQIEHTPDGASSYRLIARYEKLSFDGLIAEVQLIYQLDEESLRALASTPTPKAPASGNTAIDEYAISKEAEMSFLSTPVAALIYIPYISYGEEAIRQRFGPPTEEQTVSENKNLWLYPDFNLQVFIEPKQPEKFVYTLEQQQTGSYEMQTPVEHSGDMSD